MALKKPLVLNGGQLQRLQTGDTLDPSGLFDPTSNLGSLSGLATNGITVHNGTAYTTVSLTAPASGMSITNPDGIAGSPTFAFTAELGALLALGTGIVVKDATGSLAARTIQGVTNQTSVTNGTGVAGNPTIGLASDPVIPGTGAVTVPTGTGVQQPGAPTVGMVRYNTTSNKFEFYEGAAWVNYGTSNTVGTVTSVDVALPTTVFSASRGAITSSGTITFTFNSQSANTVFAAPDGLAGTPTFRALTATDIPNLPWSKITSGTPTTLSGYGITDAVLSSTTVAAGTGLTGGGVLGNLGGTVTISMPNVGTAVANQFVKITTDAQGRVSATSAVGAADITTALGYTPVDKTGDTMSGNLTFTGGATVTGLPLTAVGSTDAASKAYVDNVVASGTTWRGPVLAPNLVGVVTSVPSATVSRTQWIAFGGTYPQTWGTLADVAANDILEYNPTTGLWTHIGSLVAGDRFVVSGEESSIPIDASLFNAGIRRMDLIQYVSGDPTLAAAWTLPHHDTNQAVVYTTTITGATATSLVNGVTYTATIALNGSGTTDNISFTSTGGETWTTVLAAIQADLDTAFTTSRVIAEIVSGHIHITGQVAGDTILITDGSVNPLFGTAGTLNGFGIRGSVLAGTTVLVANTLSADNGRTGLFSGGADGTHSWVEIGGPAAINAGIGLVYDGNTLNVNLGAGIAQLPTDEVGIDLYASASSALILTVDGTTRTTTTGSQLALLLDGNTLAQGANGLKVNASGITETELNASVAGAGLSGGAGTALSVNVDNSSLEITTDTLNVKAGGITPAMLSAAVAGLGLVNTGTSLDINVGTGALQTTGDVLDIKTGGVTNAMLANSTTTFAGTSGTPTAVSLGGTLTIAAGTGISTTASANTVTVALNATLDNLSDVTITTAAAGDIIFRNAGNTAWVNGAPGATSGVQPYDTTLTALAGLTATPGLVVESGVDAFVTRVITGTAGRVVVTNGDGIAGDPTIDLATGIVTPGTYTSVTVDTYGRVTAGTAIELNTQVAMVNSNAGSIVIGTPVYVSTAGHVDKADAGATSTTRVIGLVADLGIATTATGNIAVSGILVATTGQWDAVTGQTGGLTAGAVYYLSDGTPGTLTTAAPTTTGSYVAPIGIALSATQIKIQVDPTIQL